MDQTNRSGGVGDSFQKVSRSFPDAQRIAVSSRASSASVKDGELVVLRQLIEEEGDERKERERGRKDREGTIWSTNFA